MKEIKTARLLLRNIYESDAEDLFEYGKEPNVGPNAGWKPHTDIEETLQVMEQVFVGKENVFGIVLKDSGKMIGSIGLIDDPRRNNPHAMMLGYAMSEHYWGKGLMTEAAQAIIERAFHELSIDIISCTCYSSNTRSRRVIEKCGFQYEGCLRRAEQRYDGQIMDIECYSLIK
jgi:Acetyltransferases, including N-acetylases of ribosomal proteins